MDGIGTKLTKELKGVGFGFNDSRIGLGFNCNEELVLTVVV